MGKFTLAAHPTPNTNVDFTFDSRAEMDAYIEYEKKFVLNHVSALGAAVRKADREEAKLALMKKRRMVYKAWLTRNQPVKQDLA